MMSTAKISASLRPASVSGAPRMVLSRGGAPRLVLSRGGAPRMADDDRKRKGEPGGPGTAVITKTKPQTKRPNMYRVLILNDDYTPMEFVLHPGAIFRQGYKPRPEVCCMCITTESANAGSILTRWRRPK